MPTKQPKTGGDGCGYLIMTCFISCCFLVLNCALLRFGYNIISPLAPSVLQNPKFAQGAMFLGPLAMVFLQWWLVDLLLTGRARKQSEN